MESGADNSEEQDTGTVTKELEEPAAKQKRTSWCKEENRPRLKKALKRLRNPTVDGVCYEGDLELGKDTVPQTTVDNRVKRI